MVALAAAAGVATDARAAPQTFNTALPVGKGNFVFREQFFAFEASDDPSPADRDLNVRGSIPVRGYGVTSDLALFGILPWLGKELDLTTPGGQRISRGTNGFGDAQIFARYTVFQKDMRGSNFRIAPFAGLELPTGEDDDHDSLGRLPQPLQSGSGSWDPLGGVIVTWQTLDYQIDAQLAYKANTQANGFEFGDEFRFDTSLQYRLLPRELGPGVPGFLYGVIEANLLHQAKDKIGGFNDPNSGGTRLYLSPGLQYVTRKWIVEAIVQIPVVQDLGGTALEDDYALRVGFRGNF